MPKAAAKKNLKLVEDQVDLSDALRGGFVTAKSHKTNTGISAKLLANVYQAQSEYDPKMKKDIEAANEPCVFFPLGALKSRAQYSWVRDVVAGAMEKMWVGTPSAIVDLPPDSKSTIREEVLADLSEIDDLVVVDFGIVQDFVNKATDEELDRLYEEAEERGERMSRLILDQWQEGGWIDAWSEAINDLGTYPVAIVKGPIEVSKVTGSWTADGKFKEKNEIKPIMYRVAPENWYPMPDMGHDVNSGSGTYELATMTRSELIQARKMNTYNKAAIDEVLTAHPSGWTEGDADWLKVNRILNRSEEPEGNEDLGAGMYHTLKFYGMMKNGLLREHVQKLPKTLDDDDYSEVELWMIDDQVIYGVMNPNPLGNRPFCVIPRQFVAGSPWGGDSLQDMIETPQRIVNALVRQHIINMGFAAQPIGEVEATRVPGGKPPEQIRAGRIYPVLASVHGEKAYRFTEISSKSEEYVSAMEYYLNKADDLSGIPGYIIGSPGAESQSTLGQTNFYYSNASKGIGALLSLVDRFLIEPMLDRYYVRNMIKVDDDSIKGDVNWQAKGLSGVFQQQLKQDQAAQILQAMTQLREVMPSYIDEESFVEVVGPLFTSVGLDVDDILSKNPQSTTQGQPGQLPPAATPEAIQNNLNEQPTNQPATSVES